MTVQNAKTIYDKLKCFQLSRTRRIRLQICIFLPQCLQLSGTPCIRLQVCDFLLEVDALRLCRGGGFFQFVQAGLAVFEGSLELGDLLFGVVEGRVGGFWLVGFGGFDFFAQLGFFFLGAGNEALLLGLHGCLLGFDAFERLFQLLDAGRCGFVGGGFLDSNRGCSFGFTQHPCEREADECGTEQHDGDLQDGSRSVEGIQILKHGGCLFLDGYDDATVEPAAFWGIVGSDRVGLAEGLADDLRGCNAECLQLRCDHVTAPLGELEVVFAGGGVVGITSEEDFFCWDFD